MSEGAAVLMGIALLGFAWAMNEQWTIIHFPPDYFPPYTWITNVVHAARFILAMTGASLIFTVRGKAGLLIQRSLAGKWIPQTTATILATVLALVACEIILHSSRWQSVKLRNEPLRVHDPVLGWTLKPSHTGYRITGGRQIEYATDVFGYREATEETKPGFARPTVILAGESIMGGFGLSWDESIAAQLSRLLQTQTVDLSVGGYATDQAYLRLKRELPRFERPVAIVFLFSPMLFRRNVDDFRPHLGPDLVLRPPVDRPKLMEMARWAVPYRSVEETDRAVLTTRMILSSTVRVAKARGAVPVILVPQFEPANAAERVIRSRVLDNMDLPVLYVPLDSSWRVSGDWHPNAVAARKMAVGIASYLHPHFDHPHG